MLNCNISVVSNLIVLVFFSLTRQCLSLSCLNSSLDLMVSANVSETSQNPNNSAVYAAESVFCLTR